MSDRIEEIRQLFKNNGNNPLHYRRIMKSIPHQIKSERTFYQIAHEVLEETEDAGYYVCYRDYENSNLVMRNSEELKGFMELRSRNQLYGFIPRKSELPKDSVLRSLEPNAPKVLTDDKRFPPSFTRNRDRLKGAIIYGVISEKSSKKEERMKNRDDAESLFRLLNCATGLLNPARFMSLIPEAFMLAFRSRKVDSDLLERSRPFSDLSKDELDRVRRLGFGSAQRICVLYTFDIDEAFDWFYENRSNDEVTGQLNERLGEYETEYAGRWGERRKQEKSLRETVIDNSQLGEIVMKKLGESRHHD
ncbi:hypothetical protein MUP07_03090 [Candidatus Bathyarchaeota archaeon]|nr:hypothetical protein [Candidatus Bathyarchaeota archaeon]